MSDETENNAAALWVTVKENVSRRKFLSSGVAAAGVASAGAAYLFSAETDPVALVVQRVDPSAAKDVGDGYVIVDGWILSTDAIRQKKK